MKLLPRIIKYFALIFVLLTAILIFVSFLLQDKVSGIILKSVNNNISTKLEVGSFRLSFLRKFPRASLELKNVLVHSSSEFNSTAFKSLNTDTLFSARFVLVEFKVTEIIKGNFDIEKISARDGKVNLFADSQGLVNYEISAIKGETNGKNVIIDLNKINLNDINVYYNNLSARLIISGIINNGKLKSRIAGQNIDFSAGADLEILTFRLNNTSLSNSIESEIDLTLQSTKNGINFRKGSLSFENNDFSLNGSISSDNTLDLNISGHNTDISEISKFLPEKYLNLFSVYIPTGVLAIDCKIKGPLNKTSNPHIEISFQLNEGNILNRKSDLAISNMSFAGYYSNGSGNNSYTSKILIKDLKLNLGSSEYSGSAALSGFNNPRTEILLRGRVYPGELKEFFGLNSISASGGSVYADMNVSTDFWPKGKITLNNIIDIKPEADLVFDSFTLGWEDNNMLFSNVNGNLRASDNIRTDNLSFTYRGQDIKVDGEFQNLPEWLAGRPVQMIASADISFNKLIPEVFLNKSQITQASSAEKKAINLPGELKLDINFKIDTLNYKTFSSSKITGRLNYKPRILTFSSLNMLSLNGIISGNGFIVQNVNRSFITKGVFNLKNIDINNAFKTFHNFGQDFLKSENIAGILSGNLSILLPMDSLFNPHIKSITAEGKYLIVDGALINFYPVKRLSSFVELSELENIHFEQLENDFFIRNNFLYIPQMDVKSTAVDLSVNGKHSFNNDYEYHVKMLLSEILSKKRSKNKSNISEFGVVEDDGLGRTSILLRIESKGNNVKVGYDLKAASSQVKNNIKAERQILKSIFNEEYSLNKSDTSVKARPVEKKTRFRISWEESDSTDINTKPPDEKKGKMIRSLLKKK